MLCVFSDIATDTKFDRVKYTIVFGLKFLLRFLFVNQSVSYKYL